MGRVKGVGHNMAVPCHSCRQETASVFCRNDRAFLCKRCDLQIHLASNPANATHERVWICEVCEENPAAVVCQQDGFAMCTKCDNDIHCSNQAASLHVRTPVPVFTAETAPYGIPQGASNVASLREIMEYQTTLQEALEEEQVMLKQKNLPSIHQLSLLSLQIQRLC